jgi:hypothetical protein
MVRSDAGAATKIAQQNPIRRNTGIWGKDGTRGTAKEAAPCRETRRRNQEMVESGRFCLGCPVNLTLILMGPR